ncbi:MAG: AGE family epimerase/isomerase [Bacteroidetes bacterium]|nr:AGE family epimerase/isomerase [Bacteroidota bacterium]
MTILKEMYKALTSNLLEKWYPLVIDKEYGGYFTNLTYDFKLMPEQEKMLVTQARHVWSCSKAAEFLGDKNYLDYAMHGFEFLKNVMWDKEYGGYFQIRGRKGEISDVENYGEEKRTYGNAFAVYGLAALYETSKNEDVLDLAKKSFNWIEENAFDKEYKGYFQFFTRQNILFDKKSAYITKASDKVEVGYKDQNSSIHLLEAYTELYNVLKDDKLREQLYQLLILIRDKITSDKGYLRLFFEKDWTPVSFRNSPKDIREKNYRLDHVSFGHDYETAFLMLEASYELGIKNDTATLKTAKKMIDHAIENGWDNSKGGFFDEGYYFAGEDKCSIIKDSKNWWAQSEGLNALLLFSKIYPEDKKYSELFVKQWEYIKEYLIDNDYGDWYWGSLEKEPHYKFEPKGSIWKGTYHNCRSLINCITMLSHEESSGLTNGAKVYKNKFDNMINKWKETARSIV